MPRSTKRVTLSVEQDAEVQLLAQRIRELAEDEIVQMARLLVSKPERETFGDTEFELRDLVLKVGAKAFEEHPRQKKRLPRMQHRLPRLPASGRVPRLSIQIPTELVGPDPGPAGVLLLPSLRRPIPVGLTPKRLTPGAERAASLAGLLTDSFAEAATQVLPELAGLHLSESTVQRTTEAAGERLGEVLDQGQGQGFRI